MRYREIMEAQTSSGSFVNSVLDLLTPLASQGVEYVTVDQLIKRISKIPSGLHVDREMVMDLLDPNKFPLIKSIEGDKLYLKNSLAKERAVTDDQANKEADKIQASAEKQAIKAVKD